jgi:hypothetical protein
LQLLIATQVLQSHLVSPGCQGEDTST